MRSVSKGSWEVLKFVTCLHVLLFINSKSIVHFCGWERVDGWGVVVCGRHNCMILNFKTCFDKKVILVALVPLL